MDIHILRYASDNCQNHSSMGVTCVKCNKCRRDSMDMQFVTIWNAFVKETGKRPVVEDEYGETHYSDEYVSWLESRLTAKSQWEQERAEYRDMLSQLAVALGDCIAGDEVLALLTKYQEGKV